MNTWYAMEKISTERRCTLLQEAEHRRLLRRSRDHDVERPKGLRALHRLKGLGVSIGQVLKVRFVR